LFKIYYTDELYLYMRKLVFISLLTLAALSAYSQKVSVQLKRSSNAVSANWQILDQQHVLTVSGNNYSGTDTADFSLEANKYYFLLISVSEVYAPDTIFFSLSINREPILLVKSDIGPGDHSIMFFTGVKAEISKIVGGTNADISDFPWQVYYRSGNFLCGGSIISDGWVVTAAHCTFNTDGSSIPASRMTVKVGATSPSLSTQGQTYTISQAIVHAGYNDQTFLNDIALLKVNGPINFPNAAPIQRVTSLDINQGVIAPGVIAWVTGWGLIQVVPNVLPTILQKVQLPIVSSAVASTIFGPIPATDLMAGYLNGNKDACNGDSGGPLVVPVFGVYKLAGIVSWGSTNCDSYGAYTRISDFTEWISTNTGIPDDFKPPSPTGDILVCDGTASSQYSVGTVQGATAYNWKIFPPTAGTVTGNTENISVTWSPNFTGSATIILRVTIGNTESDWSGITANVLMRTRLKGQSGDITVCSGQRVLLDVSAEGDHLVYSWYKDQKLVSSGVSSRLDIPYSTVSNTGIYTCTISGTCNTVTTMPINVTVLPLTNIASISSDVQAIFGGDATLEVNATGYNLAYQWFKDNTSIVNSDTSRLFLKSLNASNIGLYHSVVKGTCGIETSTPVYLFVSREVTQSGTEILVWPTVTTDEFNVALNNNESYTIQIYSTMGRLIREIKNNRYQTVVNIGTLPGGMYVVNIFNNSIRKSIKVLKP
jgi:hypothetical protein